MKTYFFFMSTIASSHRQMIRKFLCCMSTMVLWKKLEAHWRFVSKLYFYLSMFSIYIRGLAHYRRRGGYSMLQWHELGKSCTSCMLQLTLTVRQTIYCTMLIFKQYHFFLYWPICLYSFCNLHVSSEKFQFTFLRCRWAIPLDLVLLNLILT